MGLGPNIEYELPKSLHLSLPPLKATKAAGLAPKRQTFFCGMSKRVGGLAGKSCESGLSLLHS